MGELTFQFTTTSGNPLRALTFEIIQRQLKSVGINFTPRFISPAVLFGGGTLTGGDWQSVMFTFLVGRPRPATFFGIGGCGGDQNYGAACNEKASALLKKAQFTADAGGTQQAAPRCRGHPGGRGVLDSAVLASRVPA